MNPVVLISMPSLHILYIYKNYERGNANTISHMKILIIKPSSLGDVIHALRVISVIRKEIPEAQLHWVIKKGLEELSSQVG